MEQSVDFPQLSYKDSIETLSIDELKQFQSLYIQTKTYYLDVLASVTEETRQKDPVAISAIERALQLNQEDLTQIELELDKRSTIETTQQ
jgi:hypothetical protein